jgi:cold shock CspA family protein
VLRTAYDVDEDRKVGMVELFDNNIGYGTATPDDDDDE